MSLNLKIEDKYRLYEAAVQGPDFDVEFISEQYKRIKGHLPRKLREDFCGTGLFSTEWVKRSRHNIAYGIDLSPEPLDYGRAVHFKALGPSAQKRMTYLEMDVRKAAQFQWYPDVIAALNFSYFIFKKREDLLKYFKSVRKSLKENGLFFLDIFGGQETQVPNISRIDHKQFSYYWQCEKFNPLTSECLYHIHFKMKESKRKFFKVFTYDWRMWTVREIKDLLLDAGFSNVRVYWEGDDGEGGGSGEFSVTENVDNCESWVSYIIAD